MTERLTKGLGFPVDDGDKVDHGWTVEDWKDFYYGLDWAKRRMLARRAPFPATKDHPAGIPLVGPLSDVQLDLLRRANDICRSMYQIAARRGQETNWGAFMVKLEEVLEEQHKVLHPSA